jgi:hypothetical protein
LSLSLGNRVLFDRSKSALEFGDHQLEPLADCGIDHRGSAFCAGNLGKVHVDVRHGFQKCGALAPRNRPYEGCFLVQHLLKPPLALTVSGGFFWPPHLADSFI